MELKEYLIILRRHVNLFLGIVLLILLLGLAIKIFQPARFKAELVLNVTRLGQEPTTDYRYDDFYRLQADERFADTVVRWLEAVHFQKDIQEKAGAKLTSLSAKRLSSQMIVVETMGGNALEMKKIAQAIPEVVNREAEKLNQWQKEKNWFVVVADEPVISRASWTWDRVIFVSLALGMFFAFWSVLIAHYFREG